MSVKMRQAVEREIVTAVIDTFLTNGFSVSIDNGDGDLEVSDSTDRDDIMQHIMLTDEEHIFANKDGKRFGWVFAVYGNDGWDVISDYTVNLDPYIGEGTAVDQLIEKYAD